MDLRLLDLFRYHQIHRIDLLRSRSILTLMAGRKDWDPRGWPHRFQVLERLASDIIGDGKGPNLFFVTVEGKVVLVTQVFQIARDAWEALSASTTTETSLEDRKVGVLASVEPDEDDGGRLVRLENFDLLLDKDR